MDAATKSAERLGSSRCLIVGGGLIGGHLACLLDRAGLDVTVLSRSLGPQLADAIASGSPIRTVEGQVPPLTGLPQPDPIELMAEADLVFFLAGSSTPAFAESDAHGSVEGSLLPALSVLDGLRGLGGERRLIFASSGGTIYGCASELPTPETHALEPVSLHGATALAVEEYAAFHTRRYGLHAVALRYSNVYGPGQRVRGGLGVIAAWMTRVAQGQPIPLIGDWSVRRDFITAGDAARAAICGALLETPGPYNVGSGESVSLAELKDLVARVSGRTVQVERQDQRGVDVPVTRLDTTRFRSATNWRPQDSLVDGLAESWNWYRSRAAYANVIP